MKVLGSLAGLFGLALLTGLTAYYGFASVGQAVASAGWGAGFVVLVRAVTLAAAGIGWWLLLKPAVACAPLPFVGVRFIREAINSLFPVATVGGDIIGARLIFRLGVIGGSQALASVLIDIFVQAVCLLIFVLAGLGVLVAHADSNQLTAPVAVALLVATPAVAGFFLALNFGAFEPVMRRLVEFGERRRWAAFSHVAGLGGSLQQIWRNHRGLTASFLVHLAIFFVNATEVWIALAFMGYPVTYAAAVAIESLGQASRAAAFPLPGGLGVQDGTLIAACVVFGVPAEAALGLALVKRIPDLVLGVPSLMIWQAMEGRRLLFKPK
ncbi:MAG TPA: lysylphosphatidylglycerol synthase domain-containing protein [Steroidobacteraceae bacterium]|jgi:putative membrane protein|nr:lysylphosphatidylglycerol synthase domain-containing protein [Steroidobacteraceae bacterium]